MRVRVRAYAPVRRGECVLNVCSAGVCPQLAPVAPVAPTLTRPLPPPARSACKQEGQVCKVDEGANGRRWQGYRPDVCTEEKLPCNRLNPARTADKVHTFVSQVIAF